MADNQYSDVFDNDDSNEQQTQEADGPKALREALKKANREREELAEKVAKFEAAQREQALTNKIREAGLPEGAAKFAAKDLSEVTDDAVAAWVEENRSLFGGVVENTTQEAEGSSAAVGKPSIDPDTAAAIQRVQGVQPGAFEPGSVSEVHSAMDQVVEGAPRTASFESVIDGLNQAMRKSQPR